MIVAIAEMGDKTQLLSFVLAAKYRKRLPIILGILVATLANHFLAGSVGVLISELVSKDTLGIVVAISFFAFGLWALKPDTLDEGKTFGGSRVFTTTLFVFFLVEMGDKTQLATVALAARYDLLVAVVMGTTLGMMIANIPAVWIGEKLTHRVNMTLMRRISAGSFMLLGAWTLFSSL